MMDSFKNILFWYKGLNNTWRIVIPMLIATLLAYLQFSEPVAIQNEKYTNALDNRERSKSLFEKALSQSQNVPALEESFNEVNQRMSYFDRKAPTKVVIDKFLAGLSKEAREAGVVINSFTPELQSIVALTQQSKDKKSKKNKAKKGASTAAPPPDLAKVLTHTVKLELKGQFASIASFVDRLRRRDIIVHFKDVEIKRDNNSAKAASNGTSNLTVMTNTEITLHFYQGIL
jgi:Tfp pilus assembly protein PilO